MPADPPPPPPPPLAAPTPPTPLPLLSLKAQAAAAAAAAAAELALFISGQIGTKWPFMPPKEPIVIGAVTRESPRVYHRGPQQESDPLPRLHPPCDGRGDDRERHAHTSRPPLRINSPFNEGG